LRLKTFAKASILVASLVLASCGDKKPENAQQDEKPTTDKKQETAQSRKNEKLSNPQEPNEVTEKSEEIITKPTEYSAKKTIESGNASSKDTAASSAVEPLDQFRASVVPENMTVAEKKKRFKALLVPAVESVYAELTQQYQEVSQLISDQSNPSKLEKMRVSYKAKTNDDLLTAVKPHPKSIALAQAAMESAWGTSRFFREANNIFGVWSFDKNEPRIAAGEKRGKKTIWVKKYPTIQAAVKDYYRVLARGDAFVEFRKLKMKENSPYELVKKLDRYSEKGDEYGKELSAMIRFNKFEKYD